MTRTPRTTSRSALLVWAISLGEWRRMIGYGLLALLSLMLIMLNKTDHPLTHHLRSGLTELVAPMAYFINQPKYRVQSFTQQWQQWQDVYAENARLRAEKEQLLQWQQLGLSLQDENTTLRELLNVKKNHQGYLITSRVLGSTFGSFKQSQFLGTGTEDGIRKHMAVVASQGLVGRVHHVAPHTSEMLLITDINSRIAVSVQGTHEHALAAGNGHDQLELRYLPKHSTLKKGDVIVTSGDADLMPAGIPVGRVISVSEEGVKVQPFAPLDALDYVSVLSVE